ncbi:o-succinylbenzoate--CoA ligase [Peribacillus saganii]|uniref:2-succinylbenzoate--CoA ligase n=1 Tax=Peribacillus saganii TaxID=2303992 RepID=A0A372LD83_9BACI|nr:o-succinylbenzoate--CoA ligase [Peribacillus saganii]RFU63648.1 o-succinylbenzoate--CoA ligase [Peribacillus saganii]
MNFNQEKLPNWLKRRADVTPDRIALEFEDKAYTFIDLHLRVLETAGRLSGQGMKKGDRVALLIGSHPDSVIIIHACFYVGLEIVMLNSRLTNKELIWQIRDAQPGWILTEAAFTLKAEELGEKIPNVPVFFKEELNRLEKVPNFQALDEFSLQDTATIMYTSGTSGKPKGVIQTYGNHWWSAVGSVLNLGLREEDCWLCSVPIFHISGFSILMRNVIYGIRVILLESFKEKEVNQAIKERSVTIVSVVTAMLNRMIAELQDENYPESFRCMLLGGGPAPLHLLEECIQRGIPVYQTYGMTETSSQIVTLAPEYSINKIGSAGKPLFPSQLKIEVEGREAVPGEAGEIAVAGPNVTPGYLNRKEETVQAIRNGWLFTGDIGYLDEEGFLYVIDRRSDLIISGGENVYPAEIEAVLAKHPAIFEAGVTGMEDEKWGKVPVAFVVLKPGAALSEADAIAHCRELLASYKVPKKILFCSELPRNSSNKLLRRELKEILENKL